MATPESKVKNWVKKQLKPFGDQLYWEMPVPNGFGKSGLDFECVINGRAFSIETKALGGKPTARQQMTIERKRRAGVKVFVIDDPYCDDARELMWFLNDNRIGGVNDVAV